MIELPFLIALALTLFAGIYDLKTTDVFEEVPALMISFGLFYWYIVSLIFVDFLYLINSILVGIFFLSFGLILFKLRLWGDGDAWILGGIGFLVPSLNHPLYPLLFLFSLLLVGAIYTLIYVLIYGLLNKKIKKKFISRVKKHQSILLGFLIPFLLFSFYLPFLLIIGFLPILYIYLKTVEYEMKKKIRVSELKEGDVIVGKEIVGITKKEIEILKKKKKYVEIQEGVRFTIVFPITLIILYIL